MDVFATDEALLPESPVAFLTAWVIPEHQSEQVIVLEKIIHLGEIEMPNEEDKEEKKDTETGGDIQFDENLESPVVILEPAIHIKVTDVIPKQFSSCGFSLSMRFSTKADKCAPMVRSATKKLNNMIAEAYDDLADVFGGISPYERQ